MKAIILRLKPNSRFHFGKPSIDENTALAGTDSYLHSDVLFSALVNNLAMVRPEEDVNEFVNAFETNKIRISSGFYCLEKLSEDGNSHYIYLYPRPVTAPNFIPDMDENSYSRIKAIKKVQFVCSETLQTCPDKWNCRGIIALSPGTLERLEVKLDDLYLYTHELITNVGLHQPNENAKGPFSVSYIQIADLLEHGLAVHFYFLYEHCFDNDDEGQKIQDWFDLAVKLIEYNGLGGERSSGFGVTEGFVRCEINNLPDSSLKMSLSKVIPQNQEELNKIHYYTYNNRGGRMRIHDRLSTIRMISEGALMDDGVQGKIVNLSCNDEVSKRNGKSWCIPVPEFYKQQR